MVVSGGKFGENIGNTMFDDGVHAFSIGKSAVTGALQKPDLINNSLH